MNRRHIGRTVRPALIIVFGIVPSILLTCVLALLLIATATAPFGPAAWLFAMLALGIAGLVGLWGAAFAGEDERPLPPGATLLCLLCGILAAGPVLFDMGPLGHSVLQLLLLGPVLCALYGICEAAATVRRRRQQASNNSLESDASKATRASG